MPARVRLQRKGNRNHPYWAIIIQSNKTNPRGLPIEVMGYWFPNNRREAERQVVLNFPRLKYWLGVGAEPTKGVIKLFGNVGFLPKRPPPHGFSTLYERPEHVGSTFEKKDPTFMPKILEKLPEWEEQNQQTKADQYRKALLEMHTGEDDEAKILEMQNTLEKYESFMSAFNKNYPQGSNEQRHLILEMLAKASEERPITPQRLSKELNISIQKAEGILEDYESFATPFTEADIEDHKHDLGKPSLGKIKKDKFLVHVQKPVTPVPDFKNGEFPRNIYGVRHPVRPYPTLPKSPSRRFSVLTSPFYLKISNNS